MSDKVLKILEALTVAAELTGTDLSDTAKAAMTEDLAGYELQSVLDALNRCRRECKFRLTLADILERLDSGLPSADEVFGLLVEVYRDDALTAVVPEIALLAMGQGASGLLATGDKTGARMAFKSAYENFAGKLDLTAGVKWSVSRGHDRKQAETAIMEAVRRGRLSKEAAANLLPSEAAESRYMLETGKPLALEDKLKAKRHIGGILEMLQNKMVRRAV